MPPSTDPPAAPLDLDAIAAAIDAALAEATAQWLWDLRNQFPGWIVWVIPLHPRWHARRKGSLREGRRPGDPVYSLRAGDHEALGNLLIVEDGIAVPPGARLQ